MFQFTNGLVFKEFLMADGINSGRLEVTSDERGNPVVTSSSKEWNGTTQGKTPEKVLSRWLKCRHGFNRSTKCGWQPLECCSLCHGRSKLRQFFVIPARQHVWLLWVLTGYVLFVTNFAAIGVDKFAGYVVATSKYTISVTSFNNKPQHLSNFRYSYAGVTFGSFWLVHIFALTSFVWAMTRADYRGKCRFMTFINIKSIFIIENSS